MPNFGLIGKNISYSFSKTHFAAKFENEELDYTYENFDLSDISEFPFILKNNPELIGLNVTIPYKESIIPYLDKIDAVATEIGAVNTIKITSNNKLLGYNTDYFGFEKSIKPYLKSHHKSALILGTGGASKAIAYALDLLNIRYDYVSRNHHERAKFTYSNLNQDLLKNYQIIINCTPIGTYPNVNECPNIPYDGLTSNHLLYDLIYNPIQTKFLICGEIKNAVITNGFKMLEFQAEKSWEVWSQS